MGKFTKKSKVDTKKLHARETEAQEKARALPQKQKRQQKQKQQEQPPWGVAVQDVEVTMKKKAGPAATFSSAKMKLIAQENEDVGLLSQEALASLSFATEQFVRDLAAAAAEKARKDKRQAVGASDLLSACSGSKKWMKAYVDVPDGDGRAESAGASATASYAVAPSRYTLTQIEVECVQFIKMGP